MNVSELIADAAKFGLVLRGGFVPDQADGVPPVHGQPAGALVLFGNAGSSFWPVFSQSPELLDGEVNPLDRWSRRTGEYLADKWQGNALFPFDGPPHHPFIRWAQKAEGLRESALGMLMHPEYGLWHAYRFAVALPVEVADMPAPRSGDQHACDQCQKRPCLAVCPVGAFDGVRYDVESCYQYLQSTPDASCHKTCQARKACPEGEKYRYEPDHAAFHMQKFYSALMVRFSDLH